MPYVNVRAEEENAVFEFEFMMSSYARDRNTVRENVKYLVSDLHPYTMLSLCKKNASWNFNIVWGGGRGVKYIVNR